MARRERPASGGWRQLLRQMRLSLCAFAVLAALAAAGILMLRSAMLRNARDTGTALAASCAAEARGRLAVFETLLTFGTASLDQRLAEEQDRAATEAWLALYFQRVHTVLGSGVVDPYAVLDGEIVAANPWEGDADYDYAAAPWYRQAVAAGGEVIFTQVYTDAISGRPVVTAAQLCRGSGAIMAFDLLPENLRIEAAVLEEGDSLFLCDGAGTLLYRQTDLDVPQETLQAYVTGLVERIAGGTLDDDPSVHDLDGQRRGVYYARMDNGWYAILTVPYRRILGGLQGAVWLLLAMFAVSFAAVAALNRRELRLSAGIRRANETVRVLGNTYYALYRVDYTRETYEMIKGSEYVRSRIPPSGPYDALLRTAGEVIEEEAFRDFTESFSCENIRQLVRRRVRDFGGEFLRRFGGTYRWVSVRVLYDASLAPGEVVLCFREVEREKQGQLQERRLLEESLRLARQNEASRQAFFRNMSHDMRTPINAILSAGQLARQHLADPARTAGYLEKIEASGRYLLGLINDILEMARMEHGQVSLDQRAFDLGACMEACLGTFRVEAETQGKTLREDVRTDGAQVVGDAFRLQQILNNLLSNAFKFTPAGGTITVSVARPDGDTRANWQFRVADTGIGMSASFLERIFEPYAREMRFTDRQAGGTGLGMSITRSLVALMGGEIRVESAPGAGSTFTVTVPLPPAMPAEEALPEPAAPFTLDGLCLLLAEDNEINLELTAELLTARGVTVTRARDGAEAVARFRESEPFTLDAILMDLQMPELDGCEAARRIRAMARPDAASVPIVAVTANAFAEDVAATAAAGMNAHISKPVDLDGLARLLEGLLPPR